MKAEYPGSVKYVFLFQLTFSLDMIIVSTKFRHLEEKYVTDIRK